MIPPFDPAGLLTAVISAALFTVAIVYMVRSRATDIETSLADVLTGEGRLPERELFANVFFERRLSPLGPVLSVGLHLVVIVGTPLLPYLFPDRINFDSRRYRVRMMEFRIPSPLYYTPPENMARKSAPARRASRLLIQEAAQRQGAAKPKADITRAAEASSRPKLQLPWSLRAVKKDIIIQPDQPPEISITAPHPLPTALLWAQAPAPIEFSRLVGAEQRSPLEKFSLPQATPAVQKPNREVTIAELQVGAAPVMTFRPPQLPAPAANVSPIGVPAPSHDTAGELPATALPGRNPMNLIALMRSPAPPASGYLLQAGNRLAEPEPGASQPGASDGPGSKGGDSAGSNSNGSGAPGAGNGTAAKGSHADLLAGGAPGSGGASGSEKSASDARSKPSTQPAPRGNLGIIIVQPSSIEAVLEGSEVLTGQPVYTVYFDVPGAPRRWILQYCVPGSVTLPSTVKSEGIVRISPRGSVQPPFPLERIPVNLKDSYGDMRRLVVFATVNERGEAENVRLVRGTGQQIDHEAVATLKRWAFRPAMRGETPVAVEALFGIPLQ